MSLEIRAAVTRATRAVIPLWPLSSFIAVNPLGAAESEHFGTAALTRDRAAFLADYQTGRITDDDLIAAALRLSPELLGAGDVVLSERAFSAAELAVAELVHLDQAFTTPRLPPLAGLVDNIVAKWISAFLDPDPLWGMPDRNQGLWSAWRAMARLDPHLPKATRRRLGNLPAAADQALSEALQHLSVESAGSERVLRREAEHLPGWVAHIKWRAEHVGDIDLTSYFAMRMTLRWALGLGLETSETSPPIEFASPTERAAKLLKVLSAGPPSPATVAQISRTLAVHPPQLHWLTWQSAFEEHYRRKVVAGITTSGGAGPHPRVQVVMCIDPRSEGLRRHLESSEAIETFGFAGFFGVPIRFASYQARGSIDALPALIAARHFVTEVPHDDRAARRRITALRLKDAVAAGLHASETSPAAPFALAETLGWFFGAATVVRTFWPRLANYAKRKLEQSAPAIDTTVTIAEAFTLEERVTMVETAIRMMGMNRTAPLVILAGHGSTSTNNLFQSALDCGACGGNPGSANARAAAAMFNDPLVRDALTARGLTISPESFFIAGEHNTVSDQIEILDPHLIPSRHRQAVSEFVKAQTTAADRLVHERAELLPGAASHSIARLRARADDWAEVYPELGLVGNAAMIIGPREITRSTDLHRRAFLHSYRTELDPTGVALETIMTAPLVVAQWINHQYYFSTVDKDRLGAGTKTIHNAIGTIGVIAGQSGDLKAGLPLQSVAVGRRDLHEPMRLTVIIQAPLERIGAIISRNQVLRHLFDNGWITLTARNDQHSPWKRYGAYGFTLDASPNDTTQGE